jgi:hypothetical protein
MAVMNHMVVPHGVDLRRREISSKRAMVRYTSMILPHH